MSRQTAQDQLRWLDSFADYLDDPNLEDITSADFESWLAALRPKKGGEYEPGSLNTIASPIRSFMAWAKSEGLIAVDPCASVQRSPVPEAPPKALSREAVHRILHAPSSRPTIFRDRTIALITVSLGLRIVELSRMRVEHWDRSSETLVVHGKGNKIVGMPLVGDPADQLSAWVDQGLWGATTGPMWPSPRKPGENLDRNYIGVILKQVGAEAGVDMTAHQLRHSVATHMVEDGVPITIVQRFMRHASLSSTEVYTRARMEQVRNTLLDRPGYDRRNAGVG